MPKMIAVKNPNAINVAIAVSRAVMPIGSLLSGGGSSLP